MKEYLAEVPAQLLNPRTGELRDLGTIKWPVSFGIEVLYDQNPNKYAPKPTVSVQAPVMVARQEKAKTPFEDPAYLSELDQRIGQALLANVPGVLGVHPRTHEGVLAAYLLRYNEAFPQNKLTGDEIGYARKRFKEQPGASYEHWLASAMTQTADQTDASDDNPPESYDAIFAQDLVTAVLRGKSTPKPVITDREIDPVTLTRRQLLARSDEPEVDWR